MNQTIPYTNCAPGTLSRSHCTNYMYTDNGRIPRTPLSKTKAINQWDAIVPGYVVHKSSLIILLRSQRICWCCDPVVSKIMYLGDNLTTRYCITGHRRERTCRTAMLRKCLQEEKLSPPFESNFFEGSVRSVEHPHTYMPLRLYNNINHMFDGRFPKCCMTMWPIFFVGWI